MLPTGSRLESIFTVQLKRFLLVKVYSPSAVIEQCDGGWPSVITSTFPAAYGAFYSTPRLTVPSNAPSHVCVLCDSPTHPMPQVRTSASTSTSEASGGPDQSRRTSRRCTRMRRRGGGKSARCGLNRPTWPNSHEGTLLIPRVRLDRRSFVVHGETHCGSSS